MQNAVTVVGENGRGSAMNQINKPCGVCIGVNPWEANHFLENKCPEQSYYVETITQR
jgi:hypothetical protein